MLKETFWLKTIRKASRSLIAYVIIEIILTNILNLLGKGGNKRKRGKNMGLGERRELLLKEEGLEYGQILRMLG